MRTASEPSSAEEWIAAQVSSLPRALNAGPRPVVASATSGSASAISRTAAKSMRLAGMPSLPRGRAGGACQLEQLLLRLFGMRRVGRRLPFERGAGGDEPARGADVVGARRLTVSPALGGPDQRRRGEHA